MIISNKTKRMLTIILTIVLSLMITAGAIAKIIKEQSVIASFSKLGVAEYTQTLGVIELVFLALFLYPGTMKIGFLLVCSYLGGAIATHLSHGTIDLKPAILLTLIWISVYLRDKSVFRSTSRRFVN
jgi:hypothetical protein